VNSTDRQLHQEFERVALVHLPSLYHMALRFTRNAADAEDLLQDTYVRAFRFFGSYQQGTNAKAWLFKILRNGFINRYRKAQKQPDEVEFGKIEGRLESLLEPRGRLLDPEQEVLAHALDAPIEDALRALPEEYRSVLLLAVVEGFTYREISATLDCPMGTVMSRLHRARRHMKSRLLSYARERGLVEDEGVGQVCTTEAG